VQQQDLLSPDLDLARPAPPTVDRPPPARRKARIRRAVKAAVVLGLALWLIPIPALILVACGALDVTRHRMKNVDLFERYFAGNGLLTFVLSPINLIADALSSRSPALYRLEDLPPGHRAEIETTMRAFRANEAAIRAATSGHDQANGRTMLVWKWYGVDHKPPVDIPEFAQEFRYLRTIAVSVFRGQEATSWHFGPLRFTLRVLFNLSPSPGHTSFLSVDGRTCHWSEDPLVIFDDTYLHRSVNGVGDVRFCLFMDILRPGWGTRVLDFGVTCTAVGFRSLKSLFYKKWKFVS
jgi:beta-hydroxylase